MKEIISLPKYRKNRRKEEISKIRSRRLGLAVITSLIGGVIIYTASPLLRSGARDINNYLGYPFLKESQVIERNAKKGETLYNLAKCEGLESSRNIRGYIGGIIILNDDRYLQNGERAIGPKGEIYEGRKYTLIDLNEDKKIGCE